MGPQGAGKGTQAELLAKELNIPAISAGALLRKEVTEKTDLGYEVAKYTESGTLVPDELMIEIIKSRLNHPDAANGWILDGFPRILSQAELFLEAVKPTHAVLLEISDEQSLERLAGRLQCANCHRGYQEKHKTIHPVCEACGGELVKRSDDTPELIKQRLEIYHTETEPVAKRFEEMGILNRVDGSGTIEEVATIVNKIFI